jgi:hypothetical protein
MRATTSSLFLAMLAVFTIGCAANSEYMKPLAGPEPVEVPPNKARVVFVRPSGTAPTETFTIIDENGHFLGDSTVKGRFSVFLDPGEHHFIGWSGTTGTVKATLAQGRTYYVEVRAKPGWKVRASLWAVNRKSGLMQYIPSYLSDTTATTPDSVAGQAHLDALGKELSDAAKKGVETYMGYSADEKADATLLPEDGQ